MFHYEYHYRYEQRFRKSHIGSRHYRRIARKRDAKIFSSRKILSVDEKRSQARTEPLILTNLDEIGLEAADCIRPEYMVFTWILCLIALASALKLYYLVKTALAATIVLVYAVLILVVCKDMFSEGERNA
jgi:adenylate cyclase 8